MTAIHQPDGSWHWTISRQEWSALVLILNLTRHWSNRDRPLTHDQFDPKILAAQKDLHEALTVHHTQESVAMLEWIQTWKDFDRNVRKATIPVAVDSWYRLLSVLNRMRVVAWEKLGCPENLDRPEKINDSASGNPSEESLCQWVLWVTAYFEDHLLRWLDGDSGSEDSSTPS